MRKSNFEKVCEFQQAIAGIMDVPRGDNLLALRMRLMTEEYNEVTEELHVGLVYGIDRARLAKELADLLYVVYGTAEAYGIPMDAVFNAVHESNMRKVAHGVVVNGKITKHEGYQAPDIEAILAQHVSTTRMGR